ncbi:retrovirus-related Pol polyprotein from transposon 297 [Trichonephila clavipes]|nr:retrovirus-related Pol polyprotein from transposon 297 [Trichonephila clavipes]
MEALPTVEPEIHPCQLREDEGTHLSLQQRKEINSVWEKYEECFQPGGQPTPFIEHRRNTRGHLPLAVPPYKMNPSKKEIFKQKIDRFLSEGIIDECDSLYAFPVVLISKTKGTFLICIVYRKLNEITVADTYPLPRMDDLLHQTKLTPFMSALVLRAGYHQVNVHVEDQDQRTSVCPLELTVTYGCHMNCLTTHPMVKQADGSQPYIIRTDASNYILRAVLLQGEGSDEHPIEYANRLLTPAECNYSTT